MWNSFSSPERALRSPEYSMSPIKASKVGNHSREGHKDIEGKRASEGTGLWSFMCKKENFMANLLRRV